MTTEFRFYSEYQRNKRSSLLQCLSLQLQNPVATLNVIAIGESPCNQRVHSSWISLDYAEVVTTALHCRTFEVKVQEVLYYSTAGTTTSMFCMIPPTCGYSYSFI